MTHLQLPDYFIQVGAIWPALQQLLQEGSYARVTILVDENTRMHCLPLLQQHIELQDPLIIEIPAGELHKNIKGTSSGVNHKVEVEDKDLTIVLNQIMEGNGKIVKVDREKATLEEIFYKT